MLLRWSIWGRSVNNDIEMLRDSIRSFRKHIGNEASYIVHTDEPSIVSPFIGNIAEVRSYWQNDETIFSYFGKATWAKWCPNARLVPGETEVLIDSDVFLVQKPLELTDFKNKYPRDAYLLLQEKTGKHWQRGIFAKRIDRAMPFINAGLIVQGPDANISNDIEEQYTWWDSNRTLLTETFHDEQGALTAALIAAQRHGRLFLLPKDKYIIVSPLSNAGLTDLNGVILFHATHPEHPAYHKLRWLLK